MNLPNALTLVRIFAVPLLVTLLMTKDHMLIAALIFLAASLTDLLDGYLARKRGQITTLGVLLDPVADKLLISSAFISLIQYEIVPSWMVVIIVGREFAVTGLRSIASTQGFAISASELGKIKMVAQVAAITLDPARRRARCCRPRAPPRIEQCPGVYAVLRGSGAAACRVGAALGGRLFTRRAARNGGNARSESGFARAENCLYPVRRAVAGPRETPMPAPLALSPLAWTAIRIGAVAAMAVYASHRRAAGPKHADREAALDGVAEGVEAQAHRAEAERALHGAGRFRRVLRVGRTGPGLEIDAAALGRLRLRRVG